MSNSSDPIGYTCQASLFVTNSQSLLKLMFIELVMPSNHLILCRPLLILPSIFPSIRVFSDESVLPIRWPKYWSFSFSIGPSSEYSGLVWSPCSPRDSQESSPTPQCKSINSSVPSHITSWQIEGEKVEAGTVFIFLHSKITADSDCSREIKRQLPLGRKAMTNLESILKSRDTILLTKVCTVKAMVFPIVQMWELDHKEGWVPKNWSFWTVVLEKTLETPLDSKEVKPVNP